MYFFKTVFQKSVLKNVSERERKNMSQDKQILAFFQENKGKGFTAYEVHRRLNLALIGSTRRSISVLTKCDVLQKTTTRVMEQNGANNFKYKLS